MCLTLFNDYVVCANKILPCSWVIHDPSQDPYQGNIFQEPLQCQLLEILRQINVCSLGDSSPWIRDWDAAQRQNLLSAGRWGGRGGEGHLNKRLLPFYGLGRLRCKGRVRANWEVTESGWKKSASAEAPGRRPPNGGPVSESLTATPPRKSQWAGCQKSGFPRDACQAKPWN